MSKINESILNAFATVEDIDLANMCFTVKSGIKIEEEIQSVNYTLCDLQEKATREGLISLGWRPPEESKELLEACKKAHKELDFLFRDGTVINNNVLITLQTAINKAEGTTK